MEDFKVFTIEEDGRVILRPPETPVKISGKDKLIQIVLLALLTNPGRNVNYPERGSGLPSLIGTNIDPSDPTELLSDVSERIEKIRDEILDAQSTLKNETPSERLRDLILLNVDVGEQIDDVFVKFRVVSEAGDEIDLTA
jgi:phage baseplate assembly protein W